MEAEKQGRTYLGVPLYRPKTGFFEFTSCEGCQLQLLNNESTLLDFLSLLEVVNFREAMSNATDDYDLAFVEGCITRKDEEERLADIRQRTRVLVAFGSCACFGGVNSLKNRFDLDWVKKEVYGGSMIETEYARPLKDLVRVDFNIPGCPVKKEEVEKIVINIAVGKTIVYPAYPVCLECKANDNICLFDLGEPCLGPVTMAGCDSWCPNNRAGCRGCRGPAEDANIEGMNMIMKRHGFSEETIRDCFESFGGFSAYRAKLRGKPEE